MNIDEFKKYYKFCFWCAGKLKNQKGKVLLCANCGKKTYIDPRPVNGAIIENENGKILLVRRAIDPGKGMWDIPGGFLELGETVEEAMIRELKEETGIETEFKYFTSTIDLYEFQGIVYPLSCVIFHGKIKDQNFRAGDDASEIKFFKPQDLPWDKIAFEGVKKALKKFIDSR